MSRDKSSTPLPDLELGPDEQLLFALMRDGVLVSLYAQQVHTQQAPRAAWRAVCAVQAPYEVKEFESNVSALDAFMNAAAWIALQELQGRQIYSLAALARRRKLGL